MNEHPSSFKKYSSTFVCSDQSVTWQISERDEQKFDQCEVDRQEDRYSWISKKTQRQQKEHSELMHGELQNLFENLKQDFKSELKERDERIGYFD